MAETITFEEQISSDVRFIHTAVLEHAQDSFYPTPELAQKFSALLNISTMSLSDDTSQAILANLASDNTLESLRDIQGRSETELEHMWAKKILASPDANPFLLLKDYPYHAGYALLIKGEYEAISKKLGRPLHNCVFFGSGPLPFSALLLAFEYGVHCRCIERDVASVVLSRRIVARLGLSEYITIEECDLHDIHEQLHEEAIILASLVSPTAIGKTEAIEHAVSIAPDSVVCMRSVRNLGALHYVPIQPQDIPAGYSFEEIFHPYPCINTSIISMAHPRPSFV